jgi:hypothetical protein
LPCSILFEFVSETVSEFLNFPCGGEGGNGMVFDPITGTIVPDASVNVPNDTEMEDDDHAGFGDIDNYSELASMK